MLRILLSELRSTAFVAELLTLTMLICYACYDSYLQAWSKQAMICRMSITTTFNERRLFKLLGGLKGLSTHLLIAFDWILTCMAVQQKPIILRPLGTFTQEMLINDE